MFAAIRAIDKAFFVYGQKDAGVGNVFVAVAGDFGGFDGDNLGHGDT